jgi:ATP-dependent Lon protease
MAQAERELKRLDLIPPASPEFSVIVSYVETLADLPWQKMSEDNLDLNEARRILDRDHYGLEKVKRRLIEYLAVRKLNPQGRGPILCFLGPPGVGKTSLGQSIADALGRKFSRMSLGGIRDEAEIRGHRRTYIGSMPGRLIQELRRAGTRNPVLMLDEIDKIGADFRGDPASALLEVLDPRQNNSFVDHYLDVPFDLSQVIFIATANYMDPVPPALRDRMEVIEIPGYTETEKLEIARRYLVPRQLAENGLKPEQCRWDDAALRRIISDYTHEAGVRELERQIGAVCRGVAAEIARGEQQSVVVTQEVVTVLLGPSRYIRENHLKVDAPGVATGLAYTPAGGEVLYIEAIRYPGKGGITLTGQIGNIMKESAQAALSLLRARAEALDVSPDAFKETDIHVHVPAGAIPKDGPSAGVAMFTALASLFTNRRVRADVGMTGEITLRGLVLPIGGLKEKSLAAMRAGLQTVIIPKLNEKDLVDVPSEAREKLRFVPVENVDQVLGNALA